ncbi:hypothetical protein [Streptomyces sp. DH10]|uniref:hypothetical protein n=1 Tax=Streptomyces sp. DH10 TaxID=3040121 RepID=UPI0024420316|nr:hypothetical protein [Streptomyces sp. DH10]MDG9711148.1 hypothetical protein [Streptomyces sp. DH10]
MRRITITAVALLGLSALTACSSDSDSGDQAEAKPKASATASKSAAAPKETASKPAGIPSPDAAQTAALIRALSAVKPALGADEEKAVSRARNVCLDQQQGKDAATVAANAKARFEGGDAGMLTAEQGKQIAEAVKTSFCK